MKKLIFAVFVFGALGCGKTFYKIGHRQGEADYLRCQNDPDCHVAAYSYGYMQGWRKWEKIEEVMKRLRER